MAKNTLILLLAALTLVPGCQPRPARIEVKAGTTEMTSGTEEVRPVETKVSVRIRPATAQPVPDNKEKK